MSGMAGLATREWFALASSVAAQVTAAVLVAGLAARVLFRRHAAARHGLWLGGLIWVLLSPGVAAVANRWDFASRAGRLRLPAIAAVPPADRIDARVGAAGRAAEMPQGGGETHPIGRVTPADPIAAGEVMAGSPSSPSPAVGKGRSAGVPGMPRWQDLFLAGMTAWGVGILVGLLRTVSGYRRVAAICRRARPLDPGRVVATRTPLGTRLALAAMLLAAGTVVASVRLVPPAKAEEPEAREAGRPEAPTDDVWTLKGLVVDEQGRPVPGASVRPSAETTSAGEEGTTALDGSFTLTLGGRAAFVRGLVADVDGGMRAGLVGFDETLVPMTRDRAIRIVVKPTRSLTVRVEDRAGAPVSGAPVSVFGHDYQAASRTGPDGAATLRIAADAQVHWVLGLKAGVGLDYFENARTRRQTTDLPPLPPEVSLKLDGARTIRIRAVDSDDRPVPGVRFAAKSVGKPGKVGMVPTDFSRIAWITTDDRGVATFDWLPGTLRACRFLVGGGQSYDSPTREIEYPDGGPPELTVRLLRATRLSGTVRFADGRPATRVLVMAQGSASGSSNAVMTRTGAGGEYAIDVPPEQVYVVAVDDEGWAAPDRAGIVLREGRPRSGLDFTLGKGTLVHGRVTEGEDRRPSREASVLLVTPGPSLPKEYRTGNNLKAYLFRHRITDDQGRYQFRVAQGRYLLAPYGVVRQPEPTKIDVKDEPELVRDLSAGPSAGAATVSGVVVERTPGGDRPVPHANIFSLSIGGYGGTLDRADDRGRFRLPHRPAMVLYTFGEAGDRPLAGFTPAPAAVDDLRVIISQAVTVTGRVVDANGRPQPRQAVMIQLDFGSDPARSAHYRLLTYTNAQGRFSYPGFPVGTEGEVSILHEKDGRLTGARTAASFQVPDLEPIKVTDLIIPTSSPVNDRPPRRPADDDRRP